MEKIKVLDYYNKPEFYRYMPISVFNALETAYLNGNTMADVPNCDFTTMILLKQINETPQLQ